uniref:Uncharacterized protein n=1 Tax=Cacopsylla melanoneura TaxID=428564 RepID=A0A8D8T117_9HEMI
MFHYLEIDGKKNSEAVCSMLYHAINEKLQPHHKQIIFLSDAAGGQNKNITVVQFASFLASQLKIDILHLYPVRGHSYNVCDRNFGLYGKLVDCMVKNFQVLQREPKSIHYCECSGWTS